MITKSALLACSPAQAFALFTERASDWWPESLRHTEDRRSEIRLLADGRFWERAEDGKEVDLGRVRVWRPPDELVLDFYPGTDARHPTEVVIRFTPDAVGTRVNVEHRPTASSAELWDERAPGYGDAWDLVLDALRGAADASW